MTPHSAHLSSLCPYRHLIVHIINGFPLSVVGQGIRCSDTFHIPNVSLVPDLTMHLMSVWRIIDHDCRVILDLDFCYVQDRYTNQLYGTSLL
jgi:hypothetical protein